MLRLRCAAVTERKANSSSTTGLSARDIAARSGLAVSAIHFYERKGLIAASRAAASRPRYSDDMLKRVIVIKAAQSVGIPLSFVRDLLTSLPKERSPSTDDWNALLDRWRTQVDERLTHLTGLRVELTFCGDCRCLSLESCPLVAPPARPTPPGSAAALPKA